MFCAYTRPRYQVSVYRSIGPLVIDCYPAGVSNKHCLLSLFSLNLKSDGSLSGRHLYVSSETSHRNNLSHIQEKAWEA